MIRSLASILILVAVAACGGSQPAPAGDGGASGAASSATSEGAAATASPEPGDAPGESDGDAPVPALSSRGTPAAAAAGSPEEAAGLRFDLPESWRRQPPSSSMRLVQAEIPGPAGAGELTVFFFGPGGGGGTEANIQRWIGQMEVEGEPVRERIESNGLIITWVEVAGTLLPSQMGTGPATAQPDSRLFGAVVEGPGGPWFFKATGPGATLDAAREDYVALLRSLQPAG